MKIGPISGDLLLKVGLGVLALGVVGMVIWTIKGKASAALGDAANALNPANPDNIINSGFTGAVGSVISADAPGRNADGSWTLGGWIYDITHPGIPSVTAPTNPPKNKLDTAYDWEPNYNPYDAMGNRF